MKTLYFECNMGAAGDMLFSALLELLPEPEKFMQRFNSIGIPKTAALMTKSEKCGIIGTHVHITVDGEEENEGMFDKLFHSGEHHEHHHDHDHHHHHSSLHGIAHILAHLDVSEDVKRNAYMVYKLIAEAEAKAHGREIEEIHFHEVGTMDAVADVVGVCMLIEEIAPDRIIASPIRTGFGTVKCAHGKLPVPAPATAHILQGIPVYAGEIEGEMCTPTGAALLKHFASDFVNMPVMKVENVGLGMGTKDFEIANCLRAILGDVEEASDNRVCELCCNIDDMTGEETGFAMERLYEAGALEVYTIPVGMKKSRPGMILGVICKETDREAIISAIFKHTSTIGIREGICRRYVLDREEKEVSTEYGNVRVKVSKGYGVEKTKPEYEDLAKIARENNISIKDIKL